MVNNANACKIWLSADPPNLERARVTLLRIMRDGLSAAEIIERLRALFEKSPSAKKPINLNEVIIEGSQLLHEECESKGISFETKLESELPPVLGDRVQMQQVLVNLARNSIEAMASISRFPRRVTVESRREDGRVNVDSAIAARELPNQQGF
jgi:C4-dicarboxylate-specific signal transduction histidine kinase